MKTIVVDKGTTVVAVRDHVDWTVMNLHETEMEETVTFDESEIVLDPFGNVRMVLTPASRKAAEVFSRRGYFGLSRGGRTVLVKPARFHREDRAA